MQLHAIDWFFIVGYAVAAFGVGIYFSRRASQSTEEFFIAGRALPWWLAGTSMVATTFAADTPLAVSGLVRKGGIYENWLWWSSLMGGMLTVYFFARLWRRAGILTDAEFIELRYSGSSASALRGFYAVFYGVISNCISTGWVILAMTKICDVLLGWPKELSVAVLVLLALAYTALSGFWGVVMTDLIQFAMAMTGSVALAGIVLWQLGGPVGMVEQIAATPGFDPKVFHLVPDWHTAGKLALITFVVQISLQWWGGGQGGGSLAQRLFSTRDERHATLSYLWYTTAHYILRPWPWIIVGLASIAYFPVTAGEDPELAFPRMIAHCLPVGLRGLTVASLLAAFMSTIDTQLNWGSSYLINDLYRRFLVRGASERHYVTASRFAMVIIVGCGALAAWQADNIAKVWIYLLTLTAGGGFLGLLRWYWWRVNAWAEISALSSSLVAANGGVLCRGLAFAGLIPSSWLAGIDWFYSSDTYAIRLVFIIAVCTAVWVAVTFATAPVPLEHLGRFYRKVRPGGWWGPVAARHPDVEADRASAGWLGWLAGVVCVYSGLFGIGLLCLGRYGGGLGCLVVAVAAGRIMLTRTGSGVGPGPATA